MNLEVLVDPSNSILLKSDTLEPIHLADEKKVDVPLDTITQRPLGASDQEL